MSRRVDLLVVGAGVYGVCAAYEACRRGLSVLLVDRGDVGGGASSNSLKVAHGGLRYLQSLDLSRCFESIRERRRWLRIAPHHVRPLCVRMDLRGHGAAYRLALRAGLLVNELISAHRNRGVAPERRLPAAPYPCWYDALIESPERVLMALLHSAEAVAPGRLEVRTYTPLRRLVHERRRLVAAELEGLGTVEVGAVVRCTGAAEEARPPVLAMNLVFGPLPLLADGCAVGLAHPRDGRNAFAVPWRGLSMLGTWNRAYPHDPAGPLRVEPGWVDECLAWLRATHASLEALRREDVRLVHAGLLPAAPGSRDVPADHFAVEERADGSIAVRGVKWTTAYGVARRAVERAVARLGHGVAGPLPDVPLVDDGALWEAYLDAGLARREPLLPGAPAPRRGDLAFAVEREWARRLDDVLLRRLGLATRGHPGRELVAAVAEALAERLGWAPGETRDQVEAFDQSFHFAGKSSGETAFLAPVARS